MALTFRPYKPCDAEAIVRWIRDENTLRLWSSDRFGNFPITADDINRKYRIHNGDCSQADNFYPFTLCEDGAPVGHLILRYTDPDRKVIRFGFVIVDETKRGKGYGKQLLSMAVKYAHEFLDANKLTLGVFAHNTAACHCYRAVGFTETGLDYNCEISGQPWRIIEMALEN